jgi:cysteine-rich repeat protein
MRMWAMRNGLPTLCSTATLALAAVVILATPARAGSDECFFCGDGCVAAHEDCEDGNTANGDGCDADCRFEVCGNGYPPQPAIGEECDDGNTVDDDGCTFPDCELDCGDGEIDATTTPPETCEDGNGTNGDGCDDDTTTEPPGNCTETACGNGVLTANEECDDGNTVDDEVCMADCTEPPTNPPTKKQQACINGVNANAAGVLKARNADNAACYKGVAAGKSTNFLACFGDDLEGKVAKAQAKTTATFTRKCAGEGLPQFAFTDATTVNGAADTESNDAFLFVFGATPAIASKKTEKVNAACQAAALALLNKQIDTVAKEANKAKKAAIRTTKTATGAGGPEQLASAIDAALTGNGKILAAAGKIAGTLAKKCTDGIIDENFDCGGAATNIATLATCIELSAFQAACESLETGDGIDLDCLD